MEYFGQYYLEVVRGGGENGYITSMETIITFLIVNVFIVKSAHVSKLVLVTVMSPCTSLSLWSGQYLSHFNCNMDKR